ncbi:hypothetical protein FCX33_26110, partial [Escherichia coli]|nr:hypothetical protein [Escherichia coli]MDN0900533.1 hypothetical protein [Escherichia coli]
GHLLILLHSQSALWISRLKAPIMPCVPKSTIIQNLGLQETVNRAGNAVQKNGDTLSGGLTFENDSILAWIRNT